MNVRYKNLAEMYSVETGGDGELYLHVVIGGMAMWVQKIKMDADMVAEFEADPVGLMPWVRAARR